MNEYNKIRGQYYKRAQPQGRSLDNIWNGGGSNTCFGDSGGPNFLGDTNTVAAVTSFGKNGNCAGQGGVFRMDQPDVHAWRDGSRG